VPFKYITLLVDKFAEDLVLELEITLIYLSISFNKNLSVISVEPSIEFEILILLGSLLSSGSCILLEFDIILTLL